MEIVIDILLVIVGVVFVLWGADRLTEGSVSMASKLGVSQMVIGLTIVALGTSMPEFCVSFVSALKGTADMAVGNVVGSNVFNAMLIVGVAAMVAPMCDEADGEKRPCLRSGSLCDNGGSCVRQ